jgi:hypothetical protein
MDEYGEHEMLGMGSHLFKRTQPHQNIQDVPFASYMDTGFDVSSSDAFDQSTKAFGTNRKKKKRVKS